MPRLPENTRLRAVGMIQAGSSQGEVARQLGVHRNTISALCARFRQTGSVADGQRTGRPRVTSRRQDNYIRVVHLRNRLQTAEFTARTIPGLRPISGRTVRNRLRDHAIRPRRPAIRPILLPRHRNARVAWCRQHMRFTRIDWANVMFSDESRFHIDSSDGRARVYRRPGERYSDACVVQRTRFGGGSVMVWGGITCHDRTPLYVIQGNLTAVRYRDEILRPFVLPLIQAPGRNVTFQHDNARPHVARVVNEFLAHNNVHTLPWPAVSPDLSPIEHVWDEMQRRLRRQANQPTTLPQLSQALVQIWNDIPQATLSHYIHSMRRRCRECIQANGGHTSY